MSADGQYLAFPALAAPYLVTYKWSETNNRYEATATIDENPAGAAYGATMSADGQYVAVAIPAASPYLKTYKWSETNNRYEATLAPDANPPGGGYVPAMSADGAYLAVPSTSSPYLATYRIGVAERLSPATPLVASAGYNLIPYNIAYIGALMESGVASDVVDFAAFWWRQDLLPPAE